MKKKVFALAVIVVMLAILATGTLAYFTDKGMVHNVITSGNIGIALDELFPDSVYDEEKDAYVLDGVMPGETVPKEVRVQNNGVGDAWIRVKLTIEFEDETLPTQIDGKDIISIGLLEGWTDGGDGYYYCEDIIAAGTYTDYLFKEVTFAPEMGNEYQGASMSIIVEAEAVQAANNGATVMDAAGWPNE